MTGRLHGKGTKEDPYLLPESIYLKYKDEYPNHAARILKKAKAGTLIFVHDTPPEVKA